MDPFSPPSLCCSASCTPSNQPFRPFGIGDRGSFSGCLPCRPRMFRMLAARDHPPQRHSCRGSPSSHSSRCCPLDHVWCHASRSMRPRICRKRFRVNWLSASGRVKYRACRMRRPPVLSNRCWRLVGDQLWMETGRTLRRGRSHRTAPVHDQEATKA